MSNDHLSLVSPLSTRALMFDLRVVLTAGIVLFIAGCTEHNDGSKGTPMSHRPPSLSDVPAADWARLGQQRIFFGHQSVGNNILDGVADIMADHPEIKLSVTKLDRPQKIAAPALAHAMVGQNGDPVSKIRDFQRYFDQGLGQDVDIAVLKFCYVDFEHGTNVDPDKLFDVYAKSMAELKNKYPRTRFLYATVPLTSLPVETLRLAKYYVKRALGRPDAVEDNMLRERFNELLKQKFPAEDIIDVARTEALTPEGTLSTEVREGKAILMLDRRYTTDTGHLNTLGRRHVAEEFLVRVAHAAARR